MFWIQKGSGSVSHRSLDKSVGLYLGSAEAATDQTDDRKGRTEESEGGAAVRDGCAAFTNDHLDLGAGERI